MEMNLEKWLHAIFYVIVFCLDRSGHASRMLIKILGDVLKWHIQN